MSLHLHHHYLGPSHWHLPSELPQYSRLLMALPSFNLFSTKQREWSHNPIIHLSKALHWTYNKILTRCCHQFSHDTPLPPCLSSATLISQALNTLAFNSWSAHVPSWLREGDPAVLSAWDLLPQPPYFIWLTPIQSSHPSSNTTLSR